jgi:glycosyltransferase involved in cell wall biosynthesis
MKISIITVCYNSATTLEKTIFSVDGQTYSDIEYIIVDGNSNDGTVAIIKKHEDKITQWISEPDKGLYDAMNKGIQMATGDLVGIVNSDDTFNSKTVVAEIAAFHSKNSIDASIGNIVQHKEDGKIVRLYTSKNWFPDKLKIGSMPPHPSIFFKRTLFQKYGNYLLDFKIGADYELIIRYFLKNTIKWKYSGITTHKMLIGGVSSSGLKSYNLISKEIQKGLELNKIPYKSWKIKSRMVWKVIDFLKRR